MYLVKTQFQFKLTLLFDVISVQNISFHMKTHDAFLFWYLYFECFIRKDHYYLVYYEERKASQSRFETSDEFI